MKTKNLTKKAQDQRQNSIDEDAEGYPVYPPAEDIYDNYEKTDDIDPEIPEKVRRTSQKIVEKFFNEDFEDDLDIPGSELDDDMEIIGNEDEENNYYSLGGDNHNDLEEDNE
jgi:hypothetical protein